MCYFEVQTHTSAYFARFFNMYILYHSSSGRLFYVIVNVVLSVLKHPVFVNCREYGVLYNVSTRVGPVAQSV